MWRHVAPPDSPRFGTSPPSLSLHPAPGDSLACKPAAQTGLGSVVSSLPFLPPFFLMPCVERADPGAVDSPLVAEVAADSLYLLCIQAIERLGAVLKDLEKIKVKSEIDAYLYTADLNYPNTDSQTCQRCETYTEKKYSDFISGFKEVIQRINYEENKKMKIVH
ncbi:interleukin-15 isoform X2 [Erythrolamprus reginae]|uniref:interleukin-15 isoform X2 n=1 Tax=Erythrolamprus reginae TaxID=121349 RepID=UPI00396C641A